ncbi:MAG TPA: zinc-binding alcohol dehydrogenase family protein [Terracidiphilus sp.]|jgi:2-desacetyl-2-hydroxyethyl bacteriochlorophyllide A dehydrogenase
MKQIVLEAPGKFVKRQAPVPEAGPGEALIRMERIGVCGSDFHAFAGRHPIYTYPRVLGHELSGIVLEIAENDKGIRAGDCCAIEPYMSCGTCRACVLGRKNCCEQIKVIGIHVDGGMQEVLAVPVALLHKSDVLSLDQLALIETMGIGAHAVARSALQPGDEALVIGAGPIGIAVLQFAAALGTLVHVVERNEWRRRFVERMGHTVSEKADGRRADVVFDATGNAEAMGASLNHVATGGKLVFVGLTRDPIRIDDSLFHRREITLLASRNSQDLFPEIIRRIEEGEIDTSPWITERLTLSNVVSDFEPLSRKQTLIKAIIDVQEDAG